MTIGLSVTHKESSKSQFLPVCTTQRFREVWKPAADELGLEMISVLPVLFVTEEYKSQFLGEIEQLIQWAEANSSDNKDLSVMLNTLREIHNIVDLTDLESHEISIG
ncbi:MAG: hypothetical protein CME32_17580 [Gimesia sp.]|nr:hypothetical protein [Gimesia sp.]